MAESRDKKTPQLRVNRLIKIRCPEHGEYTLSMLPPFSCPGCGLEDCRIESSMNESNFPTMSSESALTKKSYLEETLNS